MGKKLSIAAAVVPWALTLVGIPIAPAVAGGISTTAAITNSVPKRKRKDLSDFVAAAETRFSTACDAENPKLGQGDRDDVGDG